MADWNLPILGTAYTTFPQALKDRDLDAATQFYAAVPTNPVTNMIRFVAANNRWERYNGTAWVELSTAYALKLGSGSTINATPIGATTASTGAFTTLTASTPAADNNSTNVATTAWYFGQVSATVPAMNGTGAVGTSAKWARADHVHPTDTSRAPLASPTFTGTPAAPTAVADTNTTQLATTAFVLGQAGTAAPVANGVAAVGTSTRFARQDHVHPTDATRAPLASPAFTGTPTAPTPTAADNSTKIATTAWVTGKGYLTAGDLGSYATLASPAFTGTPTAPTPATSDNSTKIATTAFVKAQPFSPLDPGAGAIGSYVLARRNAVSSTSLGGVVAGSELRPVNAEGGNSGAVLSGSWRCMGQTDTANNAAQTTLFLRIS